MIHWGIENKKPLGQEGHIFHQEFGGGGRGSDVLHWFLLSLKVKASGGPSPSDPPPPPYPKCYCQQYQIFKKKKKKEVVK